MKYYAYEAFKNDTNTLIKKVNNYNAQAIVGIARGGLTLAHTMAEGLGIRDVQTLRTEFYDDDTQRDTISLFGRCDFGDMQRVLVVDDIADSGKTLEHIMQYLRDTYPLVEFQSATLFYKKTSVYEPHFWINEAKEWIDFFWESDYK